MALTDSFYNAVNSGDVLNVRIMMQDSLLVDPTFAEFDAMQKAAASMAGLYDHHDGKELIQDKSQWTDEYMDKVMVKVLSNFSAERLEHLKEVVRYLRPVEFSQPSKPAPIARTKCEPSGQSSYQEEKRRCQERGDFRGVKIGTGAVAGATAGGVIASVAGASSAGVIGGIVAGAIIGSIAATILTGGLE